MNKKYLNNSTGEVRTKKEWLSVITKYDIESRELETKEDVFEELLESVYVKA